MQQPAAVMRIDGAGDVAGDFHMLNLIPADRNDVGIKGQNVGCH